MSLEAIISHIISNADTEAKKIIQQAKIEAQNLSRQAQLEADNFYQQAIKQAGLEAEKYRQRLIVNARLESRKNLLQAKQELISGVLSQVKSGLGKQQLKKQQIAQDRIHEVGEDADFYLGVIRAERETEIAGVLFE